VTAVTSVAPFMKWAGGKRKHCARITELLLQGRQRIEGAYHEPFLGGGAEALHLLSMSVLPAERFILSDANRELAATWCCVQAQPQALTARLDALARAYAPEHLEGEEAIAHAEAFYYKVRGAKGKSPVAVAARFLFLNRAGFNGLYRVNSKGGFNVPWGHSVTRDVVRAESLAAVHRVIAGAHVSIQRTDYLDAFRQAVAGDIIYADPPYVSAAKAGKGFTAYTPGGFLREDQVALATFATGAIERGVRVVLSNHDTATVRDLYHEADGWTLEPVGETRRINSNGAGRGKVAALLIHGGGR